MKSNGHDQPREVRIRRSGLAWGLFGLTLLVMTAGVVFGIRYGSSINEVPDHEAIGAGLYVGLLLFSVPGLFLSLRRPSHPIGWLLLGFALAWSALGAGADYSAAGALTSHGPLPGMEWTALIASTAWVFGFLFLGLVIFLFPTGAPPSRRWRWVVPTGFIATGLIVAATTLHPGLDPDSAIENPLGWQGGATILDNVLSFGFGLQYLAAAGVAVSMIVRYRNSRGIERQQLTFLTFAVSLAALISILLSVRDRFDIGSNSGWGFEVLQFVGLVAAGFIPVAIVVAIMKYGLYDLGRIVNRTIVYSILILILGLLYSAAVFATSEILSFGDGNVGVAASTLLVAALFSPARKRIQQFVNRRLYRSTYDSADLLEQFQRSLRNVVDSDEIGGQLVAIVERTFHPEAIGVWVNDE